VREVVDEVAVGRQHEQPRRLAIEPSGDLERAPAEPLFEQVEDEWRLSLVVAAGVARRFVQEEIGAKHGRFDHLPFEDHPFVADPADRVPADLAVDLDDASADQRPRLLARGQTGPGEVPVEPRPPLRSALVVRLPRSHASPSLSEAPCWLVKQAVCGGRTPDAPKRL